MYIYMYILYFCLPVSLSFAPTLSFSLSLFLACARAFVGSLSVSLLSCLCLPVFVCVSDYVSLCAFVRGGFVHCVCSRVCGYVPVFLFSPLSRFFADFLSLAFSLSLSLCASACVRACVRACMFACVHSCVCVCV